MPSLPPTLAPTGLAAYGVLALSQRPAGARLAEVARAVRAPLSSTQSALGVLERGGLVGRVGSTRPTYQLTPRGQAIVEEVVLAARHDDPRRALDVLLRASSSVVFAAADDRGYVVVRREADPTAPILDQIVERLQLARSIGWSTYDDTEFRRIVRVALDLRARIGAAELVKTPEPSVWVPGR